MQPQSPVLPGFNFPEIHLGASQPQYQTLPAIRTADGLHITRWDPEIQELAALQGGDASLFISLWIPPDCEKCGEPVLFPPILPEIATAQEVVDRAAKQHKDALQTSATAAGNGQGQAPINPLPEDPEALVPDDEIKTLFMEIWDSQVGKPGYRERRWKKLRQLLRIRGIEL